MDGEVLPTMLDNSNVTIMVDEVNNTEIVTVVSYAAEATVVTPAAYACNVSSFAFLCLVDVKQCLATVLSVQSWSHVYMPVQIPFCIMLASCHACIKNAKT